MLSLKTQILLQTNELMTVMSAWRENQLLNVGVTYLHLLLYSRPPLSLHYLCHSRHLESIMHKGQGAGRCFI